MADSTLGERLRGLRQASGRTLADVGEACGLSPSFLSLVENGKSDITIGRLTRLVEVFGVSIMELLDAPTTADEHILRRHERHHLHSPSEGIDVYLLARATGLLMPQLLEIRPGASLAEPGQHPGDEWLYVLSGEMLLEVDGFPNRLLGPGDAAYYDSKRPHSFRNPSSERAATLICVNSPPNR